MMVLVGVGGTDNKSKKGHNHYHPVVLITLSKSTGLALTIVHAVHCTIWGLGEWGGYLLHCCLGYVQLLQVPVDGSKVS